MRNLEVPDALGMATVLVMPRGVSEATREPWEYEGSDAPYIQWRTDDLAEFLIRLLPSGR